VGFLCGGRGGGGLFVKCFVGGELVLGGVFCIECLGFLLVIGIGGGGGGGGFLSFCGGTYNDIFQHHKLYHRKVCRS